MPDKNLLIALDGQPSESSALITRKKKVFFIPADSDHKVRVSFIGTTGEVPFSDWSSSSKTGRKGKALTGKVRSDARGRFAYDADSIPASGSGIGPRANPELIVDGGEPGPFKRKRAKPGKKKVARKK